MPLFICLALQRLYQSYRYKHVHRPIKNKPVKRRGGVRQGHEVKQDEHGSD